MAELPSTIETEALGELTYNEVAKCYETTIEIEGLNVFADVAIDAETIDQFQNGMETLLRALNKFEDTYVTGALAAARDYRELYNQNWKGDNASLDLQEFCDNLEVNQMWVDKECRYGLSFGTNGMFPGHAIRVDFDPNLERAETRLW